MTLTHFIYLHLSLSAVTVIHAACKANVILISLEFYLRPTAGNREVTVKLFIESRNGVVSIVTIRGYITGKDKKFFFSNFQTEFGTQKISHSIGRGSMPGPKATVG
jgi:hypothetical protein